MRLDKDKLLDMVALPDAELWKMIVEIGRGHGFTLPEKAPPHEELEKLRGIVKDGSKMNVASALRLLNKYKGG